MDAATQIKREAKRLGFDACGIAPACSVDQPEHEYMEEWLKNGFHAEMSYLERHKDMRYDPRVLQKNVQSIVVVALNYYPPVHQRHDAPAFARYAYGDDYHYIFKQKLKELLAFINDRIASVNGRVFTDSAPVMERYWAWLAGLGWRGKNTQLIIPGKGSFFFLGELFLDIPLTYDKPLESFGCGVCRNCLDACPGGALVQPYVLDANRCISYQTIENRNSIPEDFRSKLGNCIYGCDRCQEVCPHNRYAKPHTVDEFLPSEEFLKKSADEWLLLDKKDFNRLFKFSAVKRAGCKKLKENIEIVVQNKKDDPNF